jgi:hypothetical protein
LGIGSCLGCIWFVIICLSPILIRPRRIEQLKTPVLYIYENSLVSLDGIPFVLLGMDSHFQE